MLDKVAVIGAGSWGTAAAGLVSNNSERVVMWARRSDAADSISNEHRNPHHLSGCLLPSNICATTHPEEASREAQAIVVAVPSSYLRQTMGDFRGLIARDVPVVVLTKGIEPATHLLMTDVVSDALGGASRVAALSGPNHAEEICRRLVSAAVVASEDEEVSRLFQGLFSDSCFRVYRSLDLRGVELCAAIKNVVAIACGVCAGRGLGDNALAVLMTRGLAEMGRFVSACGGLPMTCMGLAGMGDLVATCTSRHSRNRSFGEALANGQTLEAYESSTGMVVEGARAALSVWELARGRGVEAPISSAVHAILYDGLSLEEASRALLERTPHEEFYGLNTNE